MVFLVVLGGKGVALGDGSEEREFFRGGRQENYSKNLICFSVKETVGFLRGSEATECDSPIAH
jgi:hypothetical protein